MRLRTENVPRLILVARAQHSTLREVARTHEELAGIGLKQQYLVINGILPKVEAENDDLAAAIYKREQAALHAIPEVLKSLPQDKLHLNHSIWLGWMPYVNCS